MPDVRIKVIHEVEMIVNKNQYPEEWTNDDILNAERKTYESDPMEWLGKNTRHIYKDETFFSIRED